MSKKHYILEDDKAYFIIPKNGLILQNCNGKSLWKFKDDGTIWHYEADLTTRPWKEVEFVSLRNTEKD